MIETGLQKNAKFWELTQILKADLNSKVCEWGFLLRLHVQSKGFEEPGWFVMGWRVTLTLQVSFPLRFWHTFNSRSCRACRCYVLMFAESFEAEGAAGVHSRLLISAAKLLSSDGRNNKRPAVPGPWYKQSWQWDQLLFLDGLYLSKSHPSILQRGCKCWVLGCRWLEIKFWPMLCPQDGNRGGDQSCPGSLPATRCSTGYFPTELVTSKLSARMELESVLSCQFDYGLFCMAWYPQGPLLPSPEGHVLYFKPWWAWDENHTNIMMVFGFFFSPRSML